jgi:hypothetical protein
MNLDSDVWIATQLYRLIHIWANTLIEVILLHKNGLASIGANSSATHTDRGGQPQFILDIPQTTVGAIGRVCDSGM